MSESIKYKEIPLTELFSVGRGLAKYTKAYADIHNGVYPVYSSKTDGDGVFASIDTYDYDGEYLTWSTDGYAGIPFYRKGKFSCTDHCGILKPLKNFPYEQISFEYLQTQLNFKNLRLGYGNQRVKVNQVKNANIKIKIPILKDGTFDLEKQKELAKLYKDVEKNKQVLLDKAEKLKKLKIVVEEKKAQQYAEIKFNDMFSLSRGKIISKPYILGHSGEYPVYSTQQGVYGYIDTYMKEGQFLLWNTDGLAGYIKKTDGKFSFTNIVGIMIPTQEIDMTNISLDYLKWYLEPIFRKHRKGRMGINGKNEYTKLNSTMITQLDISIPIPVNEDGSFNLDRQKELAQKYASIETIKDEICKQIKTLTNIVVC